MLLLLVKILIKVEIYFNVMYPSGHKQLMVIETQDPSTLLLPHPKGMSLSKIFHHHYICIPTNRKGEEVEGSSRRCMHLFSSHPVAAGEAGK